MTSDDVIRRTKIAQLAQYEEVGPMTDCAGFYAYRRYPPSMALSEVLTRDGRSAVRCLAQFIVDEPRVGSSISRVLLRTRMSRRWNPGVIASTVDPDRSEQGDPDSPTPHSAAILRRARRPLDLSFRDEYIYDDQQEAFLDDAGNKITPAQMLESTFAGHCRTVHWRFLVTWKAESALLWLVNRSVWRGQDAAMCLLLNFYDVELKDKDLRSPVHRYKPHEFQRVAEAGDARPQFFGFQSSRKSFFTNLLAVGAAVVLVYWKVPRTGLIRAIYNNTALSTAALILAFILADVSGPWFLIRAICQLSRLRERVTFFFRKVPI